jgi:hypothetical protein
MVIKRWVAGAGRLPYLIERVLILSFPAWGGERGKNMFDPE